MALHIYRYRRDSPFTDTQLQRNVHASATNIAAAGGGVYDIQVDDTRLADLDEIMAAAGFLRISTDPVGTPVSQVRIGDGTILTLGAVTAGQIITRTGSTLVGIPALAVDVRDQILFDHFVSNNVSAAQSTIGLSGWIVAATGTGNNQAIIAEAGHPGIIVLTNGTAAAARSAIHLGNTTFRNILAGGTNPIEYECLVSFRVGVASTNMLRVQIGLGEGWALANPNPLTDGIYFRLEPLLSGNVFGVVANTSVRSTVDLGFAPVVGNWYRLGFTYTPSGTPSVQFKLNGVNVGSPVTTNIPSVLLGAGLRTDAVAAGIASDLYVDYVGVTQMTDKET